MDEMKQIFTLSRVSKGGAVFNQKKLNWYNEHYLREKPVDELLPRVKAEADKHGFENVDDDYLAQVIELMKERVTLLPEFITLGTFFFEDPKEYEEKAVKKWKDDSAELVQSYLERVEQMDEDDFEAARLKDTLKQVIEEKGVGFGKLMMPLRVAVTGMGFGPDLFPALELLGKETTLRRMKTAIEKLGD